MALFIFQKQQRKTKQKCPIIVFDSNKLSLEEGVTCFNWITRDFQSNYFFTDELRNSSDLKTHKIVLRCPTIPTHSLVCLYYPDYPEPVTNKVSVLRSKLEIINKSSFYFSFSDRKKHFDRLFPTEVDVRLLFSEMSLDLNGFNYLVNTNKHQFPMNNLSIKQNKIVDHTETYTVVKKIRTRQM